MSTADLDKEDAQLFSFIEDAIFNGLPKEDARVWANRWHEAISHVVTFGRSARNFIIWLLVDSKDGVIRLSDERGAKAIKNIARLHGIKIRGELVSQPEWSAARLSALEAKEAAKSRTASIAPEIASWTANIWSTGAAVRGAVRAAVMAAQEKDIHNAKSFDVSARYAVETSAWRKMADRLIAEMKRCE